MLGPKIPRESSRQFSLLTKDITVSTWLAYKKFLGRRCHESRGGATICPLVRKILGHTQYDLT